MDYSALFSERELRDTLQDIQDQCVSITYCLQSVILYDLPEGGVLRKGVQYPLYTPST